MRADLSYDPYRPSCAEEALALWELYAQDPLRWIDDGCVWIQTRDGEAGAPWEPLRLWPAQREVVRLLHTEPRLVGFKARQLGFTWLAVALLIHAAVFKLGSTCLILSLREEEAIGALDRGRGIYARLPRWQRAAKILKGQDGGTQLHLSTGSKLHALSSKGGDSHTADAVLVDESALIPDLARVLARVEPTVGDGGRLWLVSRANKDEPEGTFANLARAACVDRTGPWRGIFLPWHSRPGRDAAWYEGQRAKSLAVDGTLDTLHEQYPADPSEALAPRVAQVRIPWAWLVGTWSPLPQLSTDVPLLHLYERPDLALAYVIGADPAEGLPTSDDSAAVVLELQTGRLVAALGGKLDPAKEFPQAIAALSRMFGHAPALVERNNHGHATNAALEALGVPLLDGPDGRPGLAISAPIKTLTWDNVAAILREGAEAGLPLIPDAQVRAQLALVQRRTLKAPTGQRDDYADAYRTAQWARRSSPPPPPLDLTRRALAGLLR